MDSKAAFRNLLVSLANGRRKHRNAREATKAFRKALLDFGSETDDNRACAAAISVGVIKERNQPVRKGLILRGHQCLVGTILNTAEGCPVPTQVRKAFPKLSQQEWDAVLRIATMVVLSLESDLKASGKR